MVVGFKEAEVFQKVAAASLSDENCSLSWARKKSSHLSSTETTEPANGSDNSN